MLGDTPVKFQVVCPQNGTTAGCPRGVIQPFTTTTRAEWRTLFFFCCSFKLLGSRPFGFVIWTPNPHGIVCLYHQAAPRPYETKYSRTLKRDTEPLSLILLRGTILNRTYGTHKKNTYFAIFTNIIWSYLLCSPVIVAYNQGSENWGSLPAVASFRVNPFQDCSPVLGISQPNSK